MAHRFPIGTKFTTRGKAPREAVVIDQLTTTNSKGEVVRESYITEHKFLGRRIAERDVCDTTIARGLSKEYLHLLSA